MHKENENQGKEQIKNFFLFFFFFGTEKKVVCTEEIQTLCDTLFYTLFFTLFYTLFFLIKNEWQDGEGCCLPERAVWCGLSFCQSKKLGRQRDSICSLKQCC